MFKQHLFSLFFTLRIFGLRSHLTSKDFFYQFYLFPALPSIFICWFFVTPRQLCGFCHLSLNISFLSVYDTCFFFTLSKTTKQSRVTSTSQLLQLQIIFIHFFNPSSFWFCMHSFMVFSVRLTGGGNQINKVYYFFFF